MKAKKTLFIVISIAVLLSLVIIPVFAYDWPQASVDSEKFHTFFGQKRVNTICHSLIFGESEVARATDDGEILNTKMALTGLNHPLEPALS